MTNPYKPSLQQSITESPGVARGLPVITLAVAFFLSAFVAFFIGKFAEMQAYGTSMPGVYSTMAMVSNFVLVFVQPNSLAGYWVCTIASCGIWAITITTMLQLLCRRNT